MAELSRMVAITRKSFLKGALATAAGAVLSHSAAAQTLSTLTKGTRFVLLGAEQPAGHLITDGMTYLIGAAPQTLPGIDAIAAGFTARACGGTGEIYADDRLRVRKLETQFSKFYPGEDRSIAFRFDTRDRSIVCAGDVDDSDALIALAKDADILVSGTSNPHLHFPSEDIGRMAARAKVRMLLLTLGPAAGAGARGYIHGIAKHYKGPVIIGRDRLEI